MEEDVYEISPNSGRLRKRIKYKKHKVKKSLSSRLMTFIKHPIFIFIIVIITGVFLYLSLETPVKKNRRRPAPTSVDINKKIKDQRIPED